ncbi:protein furry isoform X2 [Anopheles darlingi]|uniref:protein furry isoform X2 n=1 Tax=Anopheles darlingi TaxID=43151 RepID=UPI0021002AF3|nr:protein furry isoform X2 [Anopheles darlingi]
MFERGSLHAKLLRIVARFGHALALLSPTQSQHNSESSVVGSGQQQNINQFDLAGAGTSGSIASAPSISTPSDSVRSTPRLGNDRTSKNGSQMQLAASSGATGAGNVSAGLIDEGDTITVIEHPSNIETESTKSPLTVTNAASLRLSLLPWNSHNRSALLPANVAATIDMMAASDGTLRPGEIVMRTLFTDFTVQAEKKIESIMLDGSDKNLPKLLQRGEDYQFDQLLQALGSVAEHCLPSLLKALLAWHKHQICDKNIKRDLQTNTAHHPTPRNGLDLEYQLLRREAAVEFIFCLALIEILRQFPFHPGHDDITKQIENLAFRQFRYKEGAQTAPNANDNYRIADLYAEVIGVLAQSRFASVRKRFMTELKELRGKEPSPFTTHSIISLLMGMKFFRVKMAPIEEFEASFQFMHECAQYFLEVKDKDIKHAMAGLFVEILVPVAATVKNEVNVPCVKNFIDLLYSQTLDACTKSKHKLALFPLVTCLLCVSQKSFFLSNWHCFLAMCLSNLKNKDPKMSRVALESLYRLLWVYIIRIKCESNSATHSRLQSIVNSLFPRGSKAVVPRDTPLNIFVKIIHFIAKERLDFAMREIVFELLCVGRPIKIIMTPERMSIGLRAFMVVADSLQQKDGEPPMPRTVGVLPSGNTLRVKKTYLNKMLTEDTARSIGMSNYFPHVRRVFVDILRALDIHCGRPLMMTVIQNQSKELDEMLTGERKPRIDLFRTCIAAVPRLTPDNMTGHELVDMLSRLTIHMDEELRGLAHQSLQTLVYDFPEWRQDVIQGFSQFLARDVVDTFPQLLDNGLRMLYAFLTVWRNSLGTAGSNGSSNSNTLNNKLTTTTTAVAGGGVVQHPIGGIVSRGPQAGEPSKLAQAQVNASLNAGTATINSNSSGSSGISSITQTTTITHGGAGIGGVSAGIGGTGSSAGSSIPASSTTSVGGVGSGAGAGDAPSSGSGRKGHEQPLATTMQMVEGLALVMLCNCRSQPRKFAVSILKEVKMLKKLLGIPETEPPLIDVIDRCCPQALEKCLHMLPQTDRTAMLNANVIDLQWIVDRNSGVWTTGHVEESTKASTLTLCLSQSALGQAYDPWSVCLFGFMERTRVLQHCPSVVAQAWPICYQRVTSLFNVIDPTPVSDNRASLLRSSAPTKKPPSEAQRDSLAHLWKNQVALAMRLIPQMPSVAVRCASPDLSLSLHDQSDSRSLSDSLDNIPSSVFGPEGIVTRFTLPLSYGRKDARHKRQGSSPDSLSADRSDKSSGTSASPVALYKLVIPLLRCEAVDVRDAAVNALGMINHDALKDLMEELVVYIREAIDRKQENMRRRRRRDALRLQLVRVLEKIAENGTFGISPFVLERETMSLHPTFVEYIDGARLYLETEADKDSSSMREVKTHFCDFIRKMIKNFSLESCATLLSRELKRNLVNLFVTWSGSTYALPFAHHGHHGHHSQGGTSGSHHGVGSSSASSTSTGITSGIGSSSIGGSVWGSSSTTATVGSAASASTIAAEEEKLQFSALQAISAVLCCGPCFEPAHLAEDGAIYSWLDMLMTSNDEKIYELAKETVVLLLESNPDIGQLLEWVIDRCYTACTREADACFLALAVIFSAREYPCDHYTSVINVTLLMTGCPRVEVHSTALQLLQILDKRFFGNIGPLQTENDKESDKIGTLDAVLSGAYCRSQMYLSRQIARLRPELTMSMFSEITSRFQTARAEARALLLQCLLPWLENVELVASSVPPATPLSYIMYYPDSGTRGRREGSGSTEATEMILNNLFYITAKFADSHPYIEELWGTLCQFWPNNLKVILRYLLIISGMAPNELLAYAKRVALYLARSCTNRLLDELMSELQTVETLNCLIERTETPPFYRLTSMRKASSHSDGPASGNNDPKVHDVDVEKGTIHTKRHSGEDPIKSGTCKSDSALRTFANAYRPPRGSDKIRTASGPCVLPRHEDVMMMMNEQEMNQEDNFVQIRSEQPTAPHPLPMPEYGGYFAPLTEFLPDTNIPISGFHRCNVAVMLLTDIVVDGIPGLDWTLHVPLMLHILFLGLDHTRRIVRDHCKKLLLNLLIVLAEHNDHLTVAKILLNGDTSKLRLGIVVPSLPVIDHNFTEPDQEFDSYLFGLNGSAAQQLTQLSSVANQPNEETPAVPTIVTEDNAPPQPGPTMPTSHVIKSLIKFLSQESSQQHPLWNYEDITAKVWSIKSADQLQCFLRHIVKVFTDSYPHARIPERWAQTALQLGLSCSSRHYAGRSLQVFRSLNVPINSRMLSDILSRLIETVAEQGEDMQGYVTELLLTLEAAVDSLDSDFRPLDVMKDIFKSTPNLNNKEGGVVAGMYGSKRSAEGMVGSSGQSINNVMSGGHTRSTSYSISYCSRKAANSPIDKQIELRNRNAALELERNAAKFAAGQTSLSRSRSAQSLKLLGDTATQDDKMTILAQLFWLSVSLLESDYEHEFLLALRLLTRVLHRLPLDRPDARDKVEKLQQQLKWSTYPGVHALLLKGCTYSGTYEPSIALLSQLTPLLNLPVCDPTQSCAFPMNVIALLPYMLLHYEDANEICIRSAENIAQVASEMGLKLENLGTVMTLYSRKTFSKESFQWTKCVVKYLYDTYAHMGLHMLAFLTEVLEKGWVQVQLQVLSVIHCMLHYVDLSAVTVQPIAGDMLRIISKYLDSPNWKEALKILKFVVTRSSSLQVVPQSSEVSSSAFANLHGSFSDSEVFCKKELAGRTMEFSFDVSQTPLIGRKLLMKSDNDGNTGGAGGGSGHGAGVGTQAVTKAYNGSSNVTGAGTHYGHAGTPNSPRRSASLSPADTAPLSGWKRPWMSQGRVRECLVNLLTTCGQRVGLPKSPSVIFSQSSDLLERQSSAASSTDETSGAQQDLSGGSRREDGPPDFGVFKDFDFLEYESESIEGESTDNFNWGVRRRPLSEGENEQHSLSGAGRALPSNVDESLSEKTPVLNRRKRPNADDSSDEEMESESPLDEEPRPMFSKAAYLGGPPTSLSLRERRHRRDSVSRSDTSGSSAGDLGDITPCNASPHLPGMHPFRAGPIRDESVDVWRRTLVGLLVNQPSSHAPDLLNQMFRLIKELTVRSIAISKDCMRYFTGAGVQLGHRISVLSDLLATRGDPPKIWYHASLATTPRLFENLRYGVLEVQEHLETFFDRKDTVLDSLDEVKASCKLALFTSDIDSANEGTVTVATGHGVSASLSVSTDPATAELLLDLGRGLYKLMFQLLLLIESDHKIAISVVQNLRQNEQMQDLSNLYLSVRGALLRCIDDAEMESLDTSTSTEGENTPTPSPGLPMNNSEFENILIELIDNQRWSAAINHVKQHKQLSGIAVSNYAVGAASGVPAGPGTDTLFGNLGTEFKTTDDLSIILNVYAHRLTKDRNDVFIVSRSEFELSEIYQILMENLLHVSSALSNMEISMKANTSSSSSTVTTMTTIPAVIGVGGSAGNGTGAAVGNTNGGGIGGAGAIVSSILPGSGNGGSSTSAASASSTHSSTPPSPPVLASTNPFKDTVDIITTL